MTLKESAEEILKNEVLNRSAVDGKRFNFVPLKKPPFWFLTFWNRKWYNYGKLVEVKRDSPDFENARYETKFIYHPKHL